MEGLLEMEEIYWAQRSKQNWLRMGERNTKCFHKAASIRLQKNRIVALRDAAGAW